MVKIENTHLNRITHNQTNNAQQVDKHNRLTEHLREDTSEVKDEAHLSRQARLLSKIRTKLDETPEIRADKVELLKKQIEAGVYEIPIEPLAQKFLDRFIKSTS